MASRDNWFWLWLSRVNALGTVIKVLLGSSLVAGAAIAISAFLSELAPSVIAVIVLFSIASMLAIVVLINTLMRSQPRRGDGEQIVAPVGIRLEEYTVEAARKHEEAARKHETDKLRLEEEARQTKVQMDALEKEAHSSKSSATQLSDSFLKAIELFRAANKRAEIADKAIVSIGAALKRGAHRGGLFRIAIEGNPRPPEERIAEVEEIIARYRNERVQAIAEANAAYLPIDTERQK